MSIRNVALIGIGVFSVSTACYADFSVQTNKWPKKEGQYGLSYNEDFYDAVTGSSEMTAEDAKEMESMLPYDVTDRWYFRYGINVGQQKVDKISNISSVAATRAFPVTHKNVKQNEKPSQFAIGYNSSSWHLELEYILTETLKYNHTTVLTGYGSSITSSVSGDIINLNAYFDMTNKSVVRPYIMAGVGVAFNKVTSRLDNLADKKNVTYKFAYNFGLGFRMHFINPSWMSNFFIDANYRFYVLGKASWDSSNDDFKLEGKRSMRGFGLSLSYVF